MSKKKSSGKKVAVFAPKKAPKIQGRGSFADRAALGLGVTVLLVLLEVGRRQ